MINLHLCHIIHTYAWSQWDERTVGVGCGRPVWHGWWQYLPGVKCSQEVSSQSVCVKQRPLKDWLWAELSCNRHFTLSNSLPLVQTEVVAIKENVSLISQICWLGIQPWVILLFFMFCTFVALIFQNRLVWFSGEKEGKNYWFHMILVLPKIFYKVMNFSLCLKMTPVSTWIWNTDKLNVIWCMYIGKITLLHKCLLLNIMHFTFVFLWQNCIEIWSLSED